MITIKELVEKAKNKDEEAFSELIEPIYNDLFRIARARLGNEDDAKDAVQEAVMNAYINLHKLRDSEKFKAWITKILVNECNHIYKKKKLKNEVSEIYLENAREESDYIDEIENRIDIHEVVEALNEKEQEILRLRYKEGMSIKQIAKKLDINENTIKTTLKRSQEKIKRTYKPTTIFVFILCVLIATSVIAVSIISYIKSLFELDSVGIENAGVQMAIENLDWYQETGMDYIDLGNGYKIALSYLVLDEMNLYMVFDLESEEDIGKYTDVWLRNLEITDENNSVIYNETNIFSEQSFIASGNKMIENNKNHMKFLYYIYGYNMPKSKSLNISFSKIMFSTKSMFVENKFLEIVTGTDISIELSKKFMNRKYITYSSEFNDVEKAIVSETGFYAILKADGFNLKSKDNKLIDNNGNEYKLYTEIITTINSINSERYIVIANFRDTNNKNLKLILNGNEYELTKKLEG